MEIVEVGIKLDKDFIYYDEVLKKKGLINDINVITHDIYYTNKSLDNHSEEEMKNACIRLRSVDNSDYVIQNNLINEIDIKTIKESELNDYEEKLSSYGYKKVFDTIKKDHQYHIEGSGSIQLQEIDNIGLVVYYDNSKYYNLEPEEQKRKLIDELNSFGFELSYNDLNIDKLRTLYYGKEMFS